MSNKTRKALFQTPGSVIEEQVFAFNHGTNSTTSKQLDIAEQALAKSMLNIQQEFLQNKREAHKERLVKLKALLHEIEEDNWKYESAEKLLGI
jgi:hypothetical protein